MQLDDGEAALADPLNLLQLTNVDVAFFKRYRTYLFTRRL